MDTGTSSTHYAYYNPDMSSVQDYYPGGMRMGLRNSQVADSAYRFGFNGQMRDDDIVGAYKHNTALFWEYDPLIMRRWNPDPVTKTHESSYAAFANNSLWFVDILGDDTAFSNDATRKFVLDIANPKSENYNPDFASHFQKLVDDKQTVYTYDMWKSKKVNGTRTEYGSVTANGRNDKGQNLLTIGFGLDHRIQGHPLESLFEETDHAIQFQQGRFGFFLDNGIWNPDISMDLYDEIDNKMWTANALTKFKDESKYNLTLRGMNRTFLKATDKKVIANKVGIHYSNLPKVDINIYKAVELRNKGSVTEEQVKKMYMDGALFNDVIIGEKR